MKKYVINRIRAAIIYTTLFIVIGVISFFNEWVFWIILGFYLLFELAAHFLFNHLRQHFQWIITGKDRRPFFSNNLLDKFFSDGFDPELGWCRKPNTSKNEQGKEGVTTYHINEKGQRLNPQHENMRTLIATFGDSFTFCRQVNDHETYQWYLSKLTSSNVLNYGVGNYGLDQSLLRLKKEYPKNKTKIVILGCVPSTIVRVLCVWKHYNEFGNILAFKPRFYVHNSKLILKENIINSRDKFAHYTKYLNEIKKHDYFYHSKFMNEILQFPYLYNYLINPSRHNALIFQSMKEYSNGKFEASLELIMQNNLELRKKLFKENEASKLMNCLINDYIDFAQTNSFIPLLLWMPQKDDILSVRSGDNYYQDFLDNIKKKIEIIDLTNRLSAEVDLNKFYSEDSVYGGHLSKVGNQVVAKIIYQLISNKEYLESYYALSTTP